MPASAPKTAEPRHLMNPDRPDRPVLAVRPVGLLAVAVAVVHTVMSVAGGYWFDEVYMLAIGRYHLDWGSVDQPPMAPALAALADAVAPGSMLVLRLPAILATSVSVLVAAMIARELGGRARAQLFTALAQATAPWSALAGHWLTPYTLEPLQWLLLAWLVIRWIRDRDDRLLPLVGVVVGVGAQTKFQILLLCAVLVGSVLVFGPRVLPRRPLLWVGAAIALLIALPTLYWQAGRGWPQLRMGPVVAAEADALYGGRIGVAVLLIVSGGVLGTGLALYGIWLLLRERWLRDHRFLGVTIVVLYLFFVFTAGRPYYLDGAIGLLAAVGAVGLQRRRDERGLGEWSGRVGWIVAGLSVLLAGSIVSASRPLASADVPVSIVRRVASVYQALPTQRRDHTVIMGQSYILAAFVDGYGREFGLPGAYSGNRGYGYFPAPPETADEVVFVGADPAALTPYFRRVAKVAEGGPDASVWLCEGRRTGWATLWPRLRSLEVGS